jgi:hypothetical protein
MMKKDRRRNELETITLRWDYREYDCHNAARDRFRRNEKPYKNEPEYFLSLPEHACKYPRECGLFLDAVEITLGNDGHGELELHHDKGVKSHTMHEYNLLSEQIPPLFRKCGRNFSIGGAGITSVEFSRRRGEHFTDTGMEMYKKLLPFLGVTDPDEIRRVKGPTIFRRNYLWNIELEGWVAFEDRVAIEHGLRPIHATTGNHTDKPVATFRWP